MLEKDSQNPIKTLLSNRASITAIGTIITISTNKMNHNRSDMNHHKFNNMKTILPIGRRTKNNIKKQFINAKTVKIASLKPTLENI
jgi:hypothetical protein